MVKNGPKKQNGRNLVFVLTHLSLLTSVISDLYCICAYSTDQRKGIVCSLPILKMCKRRANAVEMRPYRGQKEALLWCKRGATVVQMSATTFIMSGECGSTSIQTQTHYTLSLIRTVHVNVGKGLHVQ